MNKFILFLVAISLSQPQFAFADAAADAVKAAQTARDQAIAKQKAEAQAEARRQQQIASQAAAQKAASKTQQDSGQMAQMLGQGLQVAGTMTMLAGSMQTPNNETMKKTGMIMMMGGMAAGLAGMFMKKKGDDAAGNADDLNSLKPPKNPNNPDYKDDQNPGGGKGPTNLGDNIKNDPPGLIALNPNEEAAKNQLDNLYKQFEQTTGIPASELRSALESGKSPLDFLDGRNGLSKAKLESDMAQLKGSSGFSGSSDEIKGLADKIGMGEIAENLVDGDGSNDYAGGGSLNNSGGGGASSLPPLDFAGLMPPKPEEARGPASTTFDFKRDVDPAIQQKLLAQGVMQGTLFQMVSTRYRQMAPAMLGYGPTERKN